MRGFWCPIPLYQFLSTMKIRSNLFILLFLPLIDLFSLIFWWVSTLVVVWLPLESEIFVSLETIRKFKVIFILFYVNFNYKLDKMQIISFFQSRTRLIVFKSFEFRSRFAWIKITLILISWVLMLSFILGLEHAMDIPINDILELFIYLLSIISFYLKFFSYSSRLVFFQINIFKVLSLLVSRDETRFYEILRETRYRFYVYYKAF